MTQTVIERITVLEYLIRDSIAGRLPTVLSSNFAIPCKSFSELDQLELLLKDDDELENLVSNK